MTPPFILAAVFLALTIGPLVGATNETAWQAGVATVAITPERPMWMAGYASRTNASQGKATELYAKVLALDDTRGTRLVIVTLDLITVPKSLRDGVEARWKRSTDCPGKVCR